MLRIFAISHDFSRTGAPLALLRFLDAIKDRARITVSTMYGDGPLAADYAALGIPVADEFKVGDVDLVLANTITTASYVTAVAPYRPAVWWIHEGYAGPRWIGDGVIDPAAFRAARTVIFPTRWQAEVLYAPYLPAGTGRIIPMGLRPPQPPPGFAPRTDDLFRILQIGAVQPDKGQHIALNAFRRLARPEIRLSFAGGTPDGGPPYCAGDGWPSGVSMTGFVPPAEIAAALALTDLLVAPTRDDLIPLAVLEAMALGVPVAASALPAMGETLIDGENARLFPVDDDQALASIIADLMADPARRQSLGLKGQAAFTARHDFGQHVNRMWQAITQAARGA